jgi:hypothetical protein
MEACARKAVAKRGLAAKKLGDVVSPNAHPPQMATRLQNPGGVPTTAVGAFVLVFSGPALSSTSKMGPY